MTANVWWYGVVRDYEAISYQFTPAFFTSHKRSKTAETRMHYTICVCPAWAERTCCKATEKIQKYNYFWLKQSFKQVFFFQRVQVPYTPWKKWEVLARRKVVYREVCTEGSDTAKFGTDEQKWYMRHHYVG